MKLNNIASIRAFYNRAGAAAAAAVARVIDSPTHMANRVHNPPLGALLGANTGFSHTLARTRRTQQPTTTKKQAKPAPAALPRELHALQTVCV